MPEAVQVHPIKDHGLDPLDQDGSHRELAGQTADSELLKGVGWTQDQNWCHGQKGPLLLSHIAKDEFEWGLDWREGTHHQWDSISKYIIIYLFIYYYINYFFSFILFTTYPLLSIIIIKGMVSIDEQLAFIQKSCRSICDETRA